MSLHIRQKYIICKYWTNICRVLLAALFIFSGFVKAVDPLGFYYKLEDYAQAFGVDAWIPSFLLMLASVGLSAIEFVVGTYLLFGIRRGIASYTAMLLMIIMTPLTLYLAIANPVPDCGCFGDAWVLTNWQTFGKNVLLLLMAISVFKWRKLVITFFSAKLEWLISLFSILYVLILASYCLNYIPILDFRPYKVGTNILQAMELPSDASEGAMPTINDFWITDIATSEDITYNILEDEGYTFLLVAHRIEHASDKSIDLINELYDYSRDYGYGFYALTSSSEQEIELWRDWTGADYPFCLVDDTELKTVIRSNPGLLLIKDGVILGKWSNNAMPNEFALIDRLENIPLGQMQQINKFRTVGWAFFWYFFPLSLILLAETIWLKKRRDRKSVV